MQATFPNPVNSGPVPLPGKLEINIYDEQAVNLGSITGQVRVNVSKGNYFYGTVTGNATITFDGVPPAGRLRNWQLELVNGGAFTVAFGGVTLVWTDAGTVPTLRATGMDLLTFYTRLGTTRVRALRSDTSATG